MTEQNGGLLNKIFSEGIAESQDLSQGQVIYHSGKEASSLFLLRSGKVLMQAEDLTLVRVVKPNEIFGTESVLPHNNYQLDATSHRKSTISRIRREVLVDMIQRNNSLAIPLLIAVENILERSFDARQLAKENAITRLAGVLVDLAEDDVVLDSHSDLGDYIDANRVTVTRARKLLSGAGMIEQSGRSIRILDSERLGDTVNEPVFDRGIRNNTK